MVTRPCSKTCSRSAFPGFGVSGARSVSALTGKPSRRCRPFWDAMNSVVASRDSAKCAGVRRVSVVLGTLVTCAAYRPPAVTVKMAQNLHAVSGGRFCFGVGAGWDEPEFEALGVPFGTAAEHADLVNWQVGVRKFAAKSRVLARLCEAVGRDPASLRRTHAPNFQLFDSEREYARWRQHRDRGMSASDVEAYIRNRGAFYGTVPAISETIDEFIDLGCQGFMVYCNAAPQLEALEHLVALCPQA